MIAAKSRRPTIAAAASLLAHDVVTKRIRDTLIVANLVPRSARNGHLPDPHGAPQAAILVSFLEFLQISHDLIKCKNRGSLAHDGQLPERKPTFECPPRSAGERRRVAACCPSGGLIRQPSALSAWRSAIPASHRHDPRTILDQIILEALSDQVSVVPRLAIDDGSKHLNQ